MAHRVEWVIVSRFLVACLAVAFLAAAFVQPATAADPELKPVEILSGLNGPIDIALASDGSIWWNEYYSGNVTRYDPADGSQKVMFHADPIPAGVERGIVGLALDPDVEENGVFYVFYTVADPKNAAGGTNRLSKIQDGKETVLLTMTANRMHNGGRIVFAKDGSMFVSTGDNNKGAPAQDKASLLGKILHLTTDGKPASGNLEGFVYTMGHRNVYGLAYDPVTTRLFATENGNFERDEINLIEAGKNYGWPACEGTVKYNFTAEKDTTEPCDDPAFTPPIGEFYKDWTAAPTGATVFRGNLYWASWNEGSIHRLTEDETTRKWKDEVFFKPGNRINDLESTADGKSLVYSNWTHIMRLDVPGTYTPPKIDIEPPMTDDIEGAAAGPGEGRGVLPPIPGPSTIGIAVAIAAAVLIVSAWRGRR